MLKQPNQHWTHFSNYCKYLFCKAHISNYFENSSSTVCNLFLSSLHCIIRHPTFFNEYHIKKQHYNDLLCISLIRTRISGKNKRFDPLAYVFIHKFMSLYMYISTRAMSIIFTELNSYFSTDLQNWTVTAYNRVMHKIYAIC